MADYRLTKCQNGWLIHAECPSDVERHGHHWIARTAAEAGEIIGREEGEHPILGKIETRSLEDNQEQEEGRDWLAGTELLPTAEQRALDLAKRMRPARGLERPEDSQEQEEGRD